MHVIWLNWSMNTHVNVQEEEVKQDQELEHEPSVKKRKIENVEYEKQVAGFKQQLMEKEQMTALYQQLLEKEQEKQKLMEQQLIEKEQRLQLERQLQLEKEQNEALRQQLTVLENEQNRDVDKLIETFYCSLRSEKIQNNILKLKVPRDLEYKIYVRKAYKELHDLIHGRYCENHILVTGNPGVGKSWFCVYELYVLLERFSAMKEKFEYSAIIFENLTFQVHCVFTATGYTSGKAHTSSAIHRVVDGKKAIHLFDCGTKDGQPELSLQRLIVFSSPNPTNNYQNVKKHRSPVTLYMPPWTVEELELVEPEGVDVAEKFRIWGGVPRYIFDKQCTERELQTAISDLDTEELYKLATQQKARNSTVLSHKMFHLIVKEGDYSNPDVTFASEYVLQCVVKQLKFNTKSSILRLIDSGECDGGAYLGELFEACTHEKFLEGGTFKVRRLTKDGQDQVEKQLVLEKPECGVLDDINELEEIRVEPVYLKPSKKNFESLDSVLLHRGKKIAMQITVNKRHGVRKNGLDKARKALGMSSDDHPLIVCFVVPHNIYVSFKHQNYLGTNNCALKCQEFKMYEQWVLSMKLYC